MRILLPLATTALCISCADVPAPRPNQQTDSDVVPIGRHVALSTPIVKAWQRLPVGAPIHMLDDLAGMQGWLDSALIQSISMQTGIWRVLSEAGYSVYRVYPYLDASEQPTSFQGIVVKVNGDLTVAQLLLAIRTRRTDVLIDEYELFGDIALGTGIEIYNHARSTRFNPEPGRMEINAPRCRAIPCNTDSAK